MRFHMLDRIDEICFGKYIIGIKCITLGDDVFNEHFPGYPIFPGSLIQEGLAQLAGCFFELIMEKKQITMTYSVLSIVNKMKFRKSSWPGDKLIYRADIITMRDDFGVAQVKAQLDGETTADGELTFSFINLADQKLMESRKELYQVLTRNAKIIDNENSI